MGTGYTRQSSAEIADGNTITALAIENEFDAIQAAMHANTGHTHDATAGEGPKISLTTSISGVLPVANGGTAGIHNLSAAAAPTANDDTGDGYAVGSLWINTTADTVYVCVDNTSTAAVWKQIQETDADLTALAGLTSAADKVPYFTGAGTANVADFTAYGRSLVAVANEAALKTLINAEAGTDFQAYDAGLADIAALAVADGNIIVGNGTNWVAESGDVARASLGLGTANSPQFTAVEIGHASDTTLARSAAGTLTVEGNVLYRAGGTDVAMADGGTGASLADPAADRILFWDDSASAMTWLEASTGLSITGTQLSIDLSGAYTPGGTDVALADGGTGASLADPNADRILFWDDSAGAMTWLTASTGLTITTTNITVNTGTDAAAGILELATDAEAQTGTDTARAITPANLQAVTSTETRKGVIELATTAEAEAGTDTARAVTPAGLLAAISGQQTMWVPAGSMIPNTTNGPSTGTLETATNDVMISYLAFDATTSESAQFGVQMPKSWDEGTLIAQFIWLHPATVTNFGVVWGLSAVAFANDDALDTAFGTAQKITDTGGTTNDLYISDETAAITVAGTPGAEEYTVFKVTRYPADAGDTMAVDAYLIGVKVHYTTNAFTDD